jgi:lipopolysaccharide export system permease protein
MMIYQRYVAREIIAATLLVTVAFLGLFGFFDLIAELRDVGKNGYEYRHAISYVALTLPGRAYELFPVCVLIGGLFALSQLAKNSEITVLRASGLSNGQLLMTLMRIGLVFVVVTIALGEVVAPPAERYAQQFKLQAKSTLAAREFRSGLWFKDGHSFVNVRDVGLEGELQNIRAYDFDDDFRLVQVREATRGRYVDTSTWRMDEVKLSVVSDAGVSTKQLDSEDWHYGLTPELLSVLLVDPDRMSILTLYRYVAYLDDNRRKTDMYEIALWKKLIFPLASLVMLVLALPFAYMNDRRGTAGMKVFIGVMLGVGFHMLNGLFGSLAAIRGWAPIVGAISPSLIFLTAALALLWWTERR